MESKGKTFANRVAEGYRKAIRFANYTILDGVGTPEEVSARIWKRVEKYLK
jgi:hypothetical protein